MHGFAGLVVFLAALPAAKLEGVELKQTLVVERPGPGGAPKESRSPKRVLIAGGRARLEEETGEVTIVRLDRGEVTRLDVLLKCYDRATFKRLRRRWREANSMLLEQIEETPLSHPQRGRLIDELTGGPDKWREVWKLPDGPDRDVLIKKYDLPPEPPEIDIRPAGEEKEIAGARCLKYVAFENGEARDSAWIAPEIAFDRRYYEFMELSGWIGPELARHLNKIRGLPVQTEMLVRGGGRVLVFTSSLRRAAFDEALFEVPPGYTERKARSDAIR